MKFRPPIQYLSSVALRCENSKIVVEIWIEHLKFELLVSKYKDGNNLKVIKDLISVPNGT